jgi:hypothetical protein
VLGDQAVKNEGCHGQPFADARADVDVPLDGLHAAELSLRTRFEKDWFEHMWDTRLPVAVSGLMVCWGCWGALAEGWAWWETVTPLAVWWLGSAGIPDQFLGRARGVPRWAMPDVELNEHETRVIAGFMECHPRSARLCGGPGKVPKTGQEVWMMKRQLELQRSLRESIGKMARGVQK